MYYYYDIQMCSFMLYIIFDTFYHNKKKKKYEYIFFNCFSPDSVHLEIFLPI